MADLQIIGAIACGVLAFECAFKAIGVRNQVLFAPERIWIWWLAVPGWAYFAISFASA